MFERKRNRPVKYDRDLMETAIRAIRKVSDIRRRREEAFYRMRMAGKKSSEKAEALKELKQGISLVASPAARNPAQVRMLHKAKAAAEAKMEE